MWQESKDKQDSAYEKESGKQSEIAQGYRVEWYEREESANGGNVSHKQRCDDLTQGLPHVRRVVQVCDKMQRVVDCDTDDY